MTNTIANDKIERSRRLENIVYISLWVIVIGVSFIGEVRGRLQHTQPLIDFRLFTHMLRVILPFVGLFLINNLVLIPRLFMKNRIGIYFICTSLAILAVWAYQYINFEFFADNYRHSPRPPHPHQSEHPLPLPLLLDLSYALLTVGVNLAVALMFQRFEDLIYQESMRKENAEHALAYLKAQINPHFYMNMLNNIHGLIEINPEKAQKMVIDMSHLMRYMLYESSKPRVSLSSEINFLKDFLSLMRQRYPESKVKITSTFPSDQFTAGIQVPPLLSLAFIENAFKHGISYREDSFVDFGIILTDTEIITTCVNSIRVDSERIKNKSPENKESGFGLINIAKRLNLLYGDRASLFISDEGGKYTATFSIPRYEN